jgi:hypothetical protein
MKTMLFIAEQSGIFISWLEWMIIENNKIIEHYEKKFILQYPSYPLITFLLKCSECDSLIHSGNSYKIIASAMKTNGITTNKRIENIKVEENFILCQKLLEFVQQNIVEIKQNTNTAPHVLAENVEQIIQKNTPIII